MEQKDVKAINLKRKKKFLGCSLLDHFELGQKVGVGTFGEVIKAKHSNTGKVVALKKIFTKSEQEGFPITSLREIKLLKNVSHPNVASLIDMAVSYKSHGGEVKEVDDIYMVFPFMDHDLTGILENQEIHLNLPQIKCYMKQLLEGISYLHQKQIMHRDLKGANLLVNNRGELKITDFGLARPLEENRTKYTPGVVTRWYRPPELLFGSDVYNESLDIWGTGCIIAEMYIRKPLFGASSDLDQLRMLCTYCGTPTEETYPGVSELPDFSKLNLKPEKRILREYLLGKLIDREAVDIIDKMLVMDPKQRITAAQALEHEYFKCEPLPCQPSEIEKFASSHVYTVQQEKEKQADSEAKKRRIEQNESRGRDRNGARHGGRSNYGYTNHNGHEAYNRNLPPPPPPPAERNSLDYSDGRKVEIDAKSGHLDYSRDGSRQGEYGMGSSSHGNSQMDVRRDSHSGHRHHDDHRHRHHDERGHYDDHRHNDQPSSRTISFGSSRSGSESKLSGPRSPSRSPVRRRADPSESSSQGGSRRAISYEDL